MHQSEPLNLKWIHDLQSSSTQTQRPNTSGTIVTPSDDDVGVQFADAESEVDEHFEEFLPSNEPNDILTTEEMQSLDDGEDEELDTSALVYKCEDLSLIWELPVRNSRL